MQRALQIERRIKKILKKKKQTKSKQRKKNATETLTTGIQFKVRVCL